MRTLSHHTALVPLMARFYGQNIERSLHQCQMFIHPCYVAYIDVMCNKRYLMQHDTTKRLLKLKDVRKKIKDEEVEVITAKT